MNPQPNTKTPKRRIKQTAWGNWYGYLGNRRAKAFLNSPYEDAEAAANRWLAGDDNEHPWSEPTGPVKLKPRTTYIRNDGRLVAIAGLTKRIVDNLQCYWSIQGDHYTSDGRFVSLSRRDNPDAGKHGEPRFLLKDVALPSTAGSSIRAEQHDPEWWIGVNT